MAIPILGGIWQLARRVENLFQDVAKLVQGLAAVRDELRQLERRVSALEGREELLVEKTRSAAAVAASNRNAAATTRQPSDAIRGLGRLDTLAPSPPLNRAATTSCF